MKNGKNLHLFVGGRLVAVGEWGREFFQWWTKLWRKKHPEFPHTVDGRNPAKQLRLVVYPIICMVLYIPGGSPDFWSINSTTTFLLFCWWIQPWLRWYRHRVMSRRVCTQQWWYTLQMWTWFAWKRTMVAWALLRWKEWKISGSGGHVQLY